jgi:hypothetical protein
MPALVEPVALVELVAAGALAVDAGVEPELTVFVERPCRSKNDTPASRQMPTSAI